MKEEKTLITTHTGEPNQPVRIYYQVVKPKTVLGVFKKLRCVYFEQALKRWRWLYEHEAKKLRFEVPYSKISKEVKPIVMGDFYWRGDQELLLEVRSFDRALKAIEFFEKRINPRVAHATKLRVVNRFFAAEEPNFEQLLEPPYDHFFDEDEVNIPEPLKLIEEVQEISESQKTQEEIKQARFEYLETQFKEKTPEIEEIPLDFYRDNELGWSGLQMALTLRNIEASQHFAGNESFSQYDLLETMAESFAEIIKSEGISQLQGIEESE
ncbi:MAG: hypothetical protein QNJ55_15660 [Xenococcus sp. MO_188.B8]|nr:hypothetical protein [Xenococcus sp. MO_188.B8]